VTLNAAGIKFGYFLCGRPLWQAYTACDAVHWSTYWAYDARYCYASRNIKRKTKWQLLTAETKVINGNDNKRWQLQ